MAPYLQPLETNLEEKPVESFFNGFFSIWSCGFNVFGLMDPPTIVEIPRLISRFSLPHRSDAESLATDWRNVGDSLRKAMLDYGRKLESEQSRQ